MIDKWIWQIKRSIAFLDSRKIKVPAYLQGEHGLLFDYWNCSNIMGSELQKSQFIFETPYGFYRVYAALLDSESRAIAESLVQSRPIFWW